MSDPWSSIVDSFVTRGASGREPSPDGSYSVTVSGTDASRSDLLSRAPGHFRTVLQANCEREDGGGIALSFGVDLNTAERALTMWRETNGVGLDVTLTVHPTLDSFVDGVLSAREWFGEEQATLESPDEEDDDD